MKSILISFLIGVALSGLATWGVAYRFAYQVAELKGVRIHLHMMYNFVDVYERGDYKAKCKSATALKVHAQTMYRLEPDYLVKALKYEEFYYTNESIDRLKAILKDKSVYVVANSCK